MANEAAPRAKPIRIPTRSLFTSGHTQPYSLNEFVRSQPTKEDRMGLFSYKLERADGTPAEPATLKTAVPTWGLGDTIPLGRGRALQVIGTRDGDTPDDDAVLIVEETA
jgi:hypothetical protein